MKKTNFGRMSVVIVTTFLVLFITTGYSFSSDAFPNRPITMIDPWPPGGGVDIVGRVVTSVGQEYLGQPLIMKYVAGAAGVRGAEAISTADPDGYTLGLIGYGAIVNQVVAYPEQAPYKKDSFVFLAQISANPCVLVAHKDEPYKTLKELIAYVNENPRKVVYSSSGRFGFVHTGFARLIKAADLVGKMVHLPTKGGSAAAKECLGGHAQVTGGTPGVLLPHIKSGAFVPLVVCDTERLPELPDVPTIKEALGIDVTPTTFWVAPCVPSGTPKERVEFFRNKFGEILKNKSLMKLASRTGDKYVYLTGQQMQKKWEVEWDSASSLVDVLLEK